MCQALLRVHNNNWNLFRRKGDVAEKALPPGDLGSEEKVDVMNLNLFVLSGFQNLLFVKIISRALSYNRTVLKDTTLHLHSLQDRTFGLVSNGHQP